MMPISGTTMKSCDCPGTTPVSGVLIDGDIPSIDTTQRGTWASGLFVVNRNGQDSFVIGFELISSSLREVEIIYFDCAIWGAGVTTINVYSSQTFPQFLTPAATNIGMLSLVSDMSPNCTALRTIYIPVQQALEPANNFFINFTFAGGSSVNSLNWLHLGEIRFSDVPLTTPTTASILTTTTGELFSN